MILLVVNCRWFINRVVKKCFRFQKNLQPGKITILDIEKTTGFYKTAMSRCESVYSFYYSLKNLLPNRPVETAVLDYSFSLFIFSIEAKINLLNNLGGTIINTEKQNLFYPVCAKRLDLEALQDQPQGPLQLVDRTKRSRCVWYGSQKFEK